MQPTRLLVEGHSCRDALRAAARLLIQARLSFSALLVVLVHLIQLLLRLKHLQTHHA